MTTNAEYKSNFIAAIRAGGDTRERAFQFFEQKLGASFKGPDGFKFYEDLLAIVREADERAVKEYQDRFVPLLDQDLLKAKVMGTFKEVLPEYFITRMKDRAAELKKGGTHSVGLFLETCYSMEDEKDLISWIGIAFSALPEHDRNVAVAFLVKETKSRSQ